MRDAINGNSRSSLVAEWVEDPGRHCCGSGCCCGVGSAPGLEVLWVKQKKKKKRGIIIIAVIGIEEVDGMRSEHENYHR